MFIRNNFGNFKDLHVFDRIGIAFSDRSFANQFQSVLFEFKNRRKFAKESCLQNDSPFLIGRRPIGEWFKCSYYIRPSQDLYYAAIGWFQHPDDLLHLSYRPKTWTFEYLVDDVEITEVKAPDSVHHALAIDYPLLHMPSPPISKDTSFTLPASFCVYFDFGSDELTTDACAILDSAIAVLNKVPEQVYHIAGHTDIIGSNNTNLSQHRAEVVQRYLVEKGGLQAHRFLLSAHGSNKPVAKNSTEKGRQKNRRVEIGIRE